MSRGGRPVRLAALAFAAVCVLTAARARPQSQGTGFNRYEQLYGPVADVSVDDLVHNSSAYEGRAVRTTGRLESGAGLRRYALRSGFGDTISIVPVSEISGQFEQDAGMKWLGLEVQVTGLFRSSGGSGQGTQFQIAFWSYVGPPEKETEGPIKAASATLEDLVRKPGSRDGQTLRVVGKFRGRNLYGDLPLRSQHSSSDWVIKDELFAVWVTGKKPKGSGFALDPALRRDTGKWLEVVGRPETRGGITYIRALQVTLTTPPTPTAEAQPPPPPPEKPKLPPVVVFALPLDGDDEVPANARFVVQFSKDMDEETFRGRVVLRYAGRQRPGDRPFDAVRLSYDGGRKALIVDPGDLLRRGRQVELLLLPGIVDVDGLPLTPRPGRQVEGAVDVLRFQVGL